MAAAITDGYGSPAGDTAIPSAGAANHPSAAPMAPRPALVTHMLGEPNNRLAYRRRDECVMCRTTQFRYIIRVTLAASRGRLLMSDSDQTKQPPSTGHDVPELVDTYRSQREALQAQANQLARLRDEIRAAAEREATDIVDAARRDVRQILVKARRELLVLTAQVQAAAEAAGGGNSSKRRVTASGNGCSPRRPAWAWRSNTRTSGRPGICSSGPGRTCNGCSRAPGQTWTRSMRK